MQRGIGDRKAVRLSVRPSVKRVNYDKANKSSPHILTSYERSMHLVLRHNMVGKGRPLLPEILDQNDPPPSKRRLLIDIRS